MIAFLGSGFATSLHTKTLRAIAPDVPRWYASRDEGRAVRLARECAGAGHFGSYDAALDSADVQVVLIALPPAVHLEWTLRALAAGKHVIVEKPPFLNVDEFDAVELAARDARRHVLVAENYFYKPLTRVLRDTIARGDLGEVRFIQLNALKRQATGDWRDDPALAGGGALFEGGIHWISLLANIGLTPTRIRAAFPHAGSHKTRPTSDRNAVAIIEYEEGSVATLSYSWDLPGLINGVRWSRVYGTAGTIRFETNGIIVCTTGRRPRVTITGLTDLAGYRGMMSDFLAAIRGNRPPAYDLTLARRDLRLVQEAYATAR
jgi:predicted dehydrogenase